MWTFVHAMFYLVFEDNKNIHKKGAVPASIQKWCLVLEAHGPQEQTGPLLRSAHFQIKDRDRPRVVSQDYGIWDIHGPPLLLTTISSRCLGVAANPALEEPVAFRSTLPRAPLTKVPWRPTRQAHNHSRALVHDQILGSLVVGGPEAERSNSRGAMSAIILGTVRVLACPA